MFPCKSSQMKQDPWVPGISKSPPKHLLRSFFTNSRHFQVTDLLSCQHFNICEYRAHILSFDLLSTSWFNGTCWNPSKTRKHSGNNCCICSPDWRSTCKLFGLYNLSETFCIDIPRHFSHSPLNTMWASSSESWQSLIDLAIGISTPNILKDSVLDASNLDENTRSKNFGYNSANYSSNTPVFSIMQTNSWQSYFH